MSDPAVNLERLAAERGIFSKWINIGNRISEAGAQKLDW
jgi:hypothetical protein